MTQAFKPNIFNIASSCHFFDSLLEWLDVNFADKIAEVKIFFPNRRACREFEQAFVARFGEVAKKPKIKAVADISYHDFLDSFPKGQIGSVVDELFKIKLLDNFDYLFFLANEISQNKVFGENISFNQSLNIALQLKNLFDEIERQEADLAVIDSIDDSNLAMHRQFTLDFLKQFYLRIRNLILKNNIFSQAAFQNFIVSQLALAIENHGLKSPMVIAGSTGSVNYSQKLIKAIARDKNGHVVLYGLDAAARDFDDESHPQFILQQLLKMLGLKHDDVTQVFYNNLQVCAKSRLEFLAQLMLPSLETEAWQAMDRKINLSEIGQDLQENLSMIVAKNEIEEARVVAVAALQAGEDNKKIAIIAPQNQFVELLKIELQKLSLNFNDARSLDLSSCKLVNLILLLLELCENNFESTALLAFLKHEYSSFKDDKNLIDFEIEVLRQQRSDEGLAGIKAKLKMQDNQEIVGFFEEVLLAIKDFASESHSLNLSAYVANLILAIENFTKNDFASLIALEPCAEELGKLFEKLKSINNFSLNHKNSLQFFQYIFAQIKYFEQSNADAKIQILSPIEARLLNFDLVILTSLNDGVFPQIEGENWLGKKIRKDLAIDLTAKKIGQNAYDFCNYLSNKKVILTRSQSSDGAPIIASPFILRFDILCKKFALKTDDGKKYFEALLEYKTPLVKKLQQPLAPKPARALRPKKLAITDISKLISNPYQIYAKKILQLRELNEIDYEPSFREFGSFIHKALEEFIKSSEKPENFIKKAEEIFAQYFINKESRLIWWPKFENIFWNFIVDNEALKPSKDYVEVPVKIFINDILITGKIDRVSLFDDNKFEIFDYKTGQIFSKQEVISGSEPQLTIAALMLSLGVIENVALPNILPQNIAALNYWKLSSFGEHEIKKMNNEDGDVAIMIAAAKAGLERLFEHFDNEENGYFVNPNSKNEYLHLARIF